MHCVPVSNISPQPQRWYEWTIGDRLRVAREQAGYEQREFAAMTGISRTTIKNYERGTTAPKPPMLAAWCLATGFSKEWILTGERPGDGNGGAATKDVTLRELDIISRGNSRLLKIAA